MKVKRNSIGVTKTLKSCGEVEIPSGKIEFPDSDLVIFVSDEYDEGDHLAYADVCAIDKGSFRPSVGYITFNLNGFVIIQGDNVSNKEKMLLHD